MPTEYESLDRLVLADPALKFRSDEQLRVIVHLRGRLGRVGDDLSRAGVAFVAEHRDLFGDVEPDSLAVLEESADPAGGSNVTYQQRHGEYPVLGGSMRIHSDANGELDTVSNRLFPDLADVARSPEVPAEKAVDALRDATKSDAEVSKEPELMVVRHDGRPYLTWEVRLATDRAQRGDWGQPTQWIGYVEATSGRLLYAYNNIQTAGPAAGNGTGYYSGAGTLNTWFTDATYQLRDTTRVAAGGPEIRTDDEDGASPSEDSNNNWNGSSTSPRHAHQGAEVDAHRYAGKVVDYFRTVHGRNSFDGAGATLTNVVHLGTDFSNGYWDGTRVNLGDGTGVAPGDDYETADDWLAHEWVHAYTQHTCGLVYNAESGALNESFSDVFAAFITGDWLVFEDSWLNPSAPAWRNMIDPTNGGNWNPADPITSTFAGHQPNHYSVRYTGSWDNGGVHINSGIINHLFYLLTVGGTHALSGVTVGAVGQSAAEQMLWRTMTVNLVGQPNATFVQFREAMLDASLDLFPTDLFKLSQVKAAFNAVGIGPDVYVRDNLTDTGVEPFPGGYLWASPDIINRVAPSANPTADFADLNDDSLWENVEFGQDNHVYVRLHNRGPENGDATVNVFFSAASTFGTPASWTHIGTATAAGLTTGSTRIVGPITFASAKIPVPGHYCMIAVVSSSLDPAPDHTLISTVSMYLDYVRGTNNIAYRNMDVVDMAPGSSGRVESIVRSLGEDVDGYALHLDDSEFVPEAVIRLRGPANVLEAAAPRGFKLVGREAGDAVYELLAGPQRERHFRFNGIDADQAGRRRCLPGFEQLRLDGELLVAIEYELPDESVLDGLDRRPRRQPYEIAVRQSWKGEPVGGSGVRLIPPR